MSEFLKRGAVGQAVGAGPLSPRSGRGNKTDNVFAYIFGKGIAKLAAFADTFTRGAGVGVGVGVGVAALEALGLLSIL